MIENEVKTKTFPHQIDFEPANEIEITHLSKLNELLDKKRRGDWDMVGEMNGLTAPNAEKAFKRVYSKHHKDVVKALEKVITNRENLLKNL